MAVLVPTLHHREMYHDNPYLKYWQRLVWVVLKKTAESKHRPIQNSIQTIE